jgi:hypothetical protein
MVELLAPDFHGILSRRFCMESSFRPPSNNSKHYKADCKKKYGRCLLLDNGRCGRHTSFIAA